MFNSSPKLKTTKKTFLHKGFAAGRPAPPKAAPKATKAKDDIPPLEPIPKTKGEWTTALERFQSSIDRVLPGSFSTLQWNLKDRRVRRRRLRRLRMKILSQARARRRRRRSPRRRRKQLRLRMERLPSQKPYHHLSVQSSLHFPLRLSRLPDSHPRNKRLHRNHLLPVLLPLELARLRLFRTCRQPHFRSHWNRLAHSLLIHM